MTLQLVMRINVSYHKVIQIKTQTINLEFGILFSVQEAKQETT